MIRRIAAAFFLFLCSFLSLRGREFNRAFENRIFELKETFWNLFERNLSEPSENLANILVHDGTRLEVEHVSIRLGPGLRFFSLDSSPVSQISFVAD